MISEAEDGRPGGFHAVGLCTALQSRRRNDPGSIAAVMRPVTATEGRRKGRSAPKYL